MSEMCQPAGIRRKSVSAEELAHIAHLARLALDPGDIPRLSEELARILTLVDEMNAVDTAGLEPMAHPVDMAQPLRSDEVREPGQRGTPAAWGTGGRRWSVSGAQGDRVAPPGAYRLRRCTICPSANWGAALRARRISSEELACAYLDRLPRYGKRAQLHHLPHRRAGIGGGSRSGPPSGRRRRRCADRNPHSAQGRLLHPGRPDLVWLENARQLHLALRCDGGRASPE